MKEHLLTKTFTTELEAMKVSKGMLTNPEVSDEERVRQYDGGFVALVKLAHGDSNFDVFQGKKGAATRRQLW